MVHLVLLLHNKPTQRVEGRSRVHDFHSKVKNVAPGD
ncbi:hypothetical protein FG05_35096 [Fusarium graminearum]|nr:hypothetical protein FG05_35096 [Fusarium graminearum]